MSRLRLNIMETPLPQQNNNLAPLGTSLKNRIRIIPFQPITQQPLAQPVTTTTPFQTGTALRNRIQTIPFPTTQPVPTPTPINATPINATTQRDVQPGQWEEITVEKNPTTGKFLYPPMYKMDARGLYTVWQIGFEVLEQNPETGSGRGELEMRHGTVDGAIQTNRTEVTTNTSGRNILEQGILEARRRYMDKWKQGYRVMEALVEGNTGTGDQPMLANKWKPNQIKEWPVAVQPKLDGIRMLSKVVGDEVQSRSRLNNVFPNVGAINEQVATFLMYLPTGTELDGELYSHEMDFTELTSAVKTVKSIHPRMKDVDYYIFDMVDPGLQLPFEERYIMLINAYRRFLEDGNTNTRFHLISMTLAESDNDILQFHNQYVKMGYEGIIIRKLARGRTDPKSLQQAQYKRSRTANLLKYKEFEDEEVLILGVDHLAKGTEEGAAVLSVQDQRGNVFPARPRGSVERRREWGRNPNLVIGKMATIRFQERSVHGVPRFPVIIAIRDYE